MKLINFFPCKKSLLCQKARFFPKFFWSRYGAGTGNVTCRKSEPNPALFFRTEAIKMPTKKKKKFSKNIMHNSVGTVERGNIEQVINFKVKLNILGDVL
jgi:hypothetical protein